MKNHNRIIYEYEQSPGLSLQYSHGVWGGINPQGEIEMNFYVESDQMPSISERFVASDGSFGHEIIPPERENRVIKRQIHSRVLLNYHTAKAMIEWLEEKITLLDMEDGQMPKFPDDGEFEQ